MIKGLYLNGSLDDWSKGLEIRQKVYKDAYDENIEIDDQDALAIQVVLYDNAENPVGTVRLMFDLDGVFTFDQLAVYEEERHKGYGDFMMHMILDKAKMCGASHLASDEITHKPEYFNKYGFKMEDKRLMLDLNEYFNTHKCCH